MLCAPSGRRLTRTHRRNPVLRARYIGAPDQWIDAYMGLDTTFELAPRAYQILARGLYGQEFAARLVDQDPLLLHFTVGFLLRFEP